MIYTVSGKLSHKKGNFVVVNCGGIGFKVFASVGTQSKLPPVGSEINLFTYLCVKEDSLDLYGFLEEEEISFFESLISVSGVGPRSAMMILGVAPVGRLSAAISSGEVGILQKASGVGRKTAERIILELKDKISVFGTESDEVVRLIKSDADVYEALVSLGYTGGQAKEVIQKIAPELVGINDRLRDALNKIRG